MEKGGNLKLFFHEYGKILSVGVSISLCLVSVFFIVTFVLPQKLHVSFLDIGQGDSILIQTPSGHTMIIDGGPSDKVLAKMNEQMNYFNHTIDVMVATHPDSDHVTGLIPVLEKYDVKNIVRSDEEGTTGVFKDLETHMRDEGSVTHVAKVGDVIDFNDGVTATILHPYLNEKFSDTNSASVSVLLSYGRETFLLTGDLPTTNESLLLSSHLLPKNITVYKAGHHGSKYSSGEQLLTYIRPEYSIISAGVDNKYGHPNPEAVVRLQNYSKEILSTIDRGTITFETNGSVIEVTTEN